MSIRYFVAPMVVTVVLALPATMGAQAPTWQRPADAARYGYGGDRPVPHYETRRIAYDQGYREGLARGESDARRGNRYAYQKVREFQRADRGYHRSLGDRERYRQIFRDGFARGYADGYARVDRYGRTASRQGPYSASRSGAYGPSGRYGTVVERGRGVAARDGYAKGLEDARKNRTFDPVRHSWYRSGDRHYQSRYGPREQYKDVYRRAFQQGYERGYREGVYRR